MRVFLAMGWLMVSAASAAEPAPLRETGAPMTFAGEWAGTWTDSRVEYAKSGGPFSCVAVEKKAGVWAAVFSLGKSRSWTVELKGKAEKGKIVFDSVVDLGDTQGVYAWKGVLTTDDFKGEYDGPGEKGTFAMKRRFN